MCTYDTQYVTNDDMISVCKQRYELLYYYDCHHFHHRPNVILRRRDIVSFIACIVALYWIVFHFLEWTYLPRFIGPSLVSLYSTNNITSSISDSNTSHTNEKTYILDRSSNGNVSDGVSRTIGNNDNNITAAATIVVVISQDDNNSTSNNNKIKNNVNNNNFFNTSSLTTTINQIMEYEQMAWNTNKNKFSKERFEIMQPNNNNNNNNNTTSLGLLPNATVTACLLIKDDNEIFNEWIAYHYYTCKLRFLIVAIDPTSIQHSQLLVLLMKWQTFTNLQYIVWNDTDYMPSSFLIKGHAPMIHLNHNIDILTNHSLLQIYNHRYRQRVFLTQCLIESKRRGHTWTMHIDTDEYIVLNKALRHDYYSVLTKQQEQEPEQHQQEQSTLYINNNTLVSALLLPSLEEHGSILTVLQYAAKYTPNLINYPCISMLRVLFGSFEERTNNINNINQSNRDMNNTITNNKNNHTLLSGFNLSNFESIRWKHHASPTNMSINGNPKVIIDVSVIPQSYFPNYNNHHNNSTANEAKNNGSTDDDNDYDDNKQLVFSIHRPIKELCRKANEINYQHYCWNPISINHYLSSWENYNLRTDHRRNKYSYESKNSLTSNESDYNGITHLWLQGFVQSIGIHTSEQLLSGKYLNLLVESSESSSSSSSSSNHNEI